MNRRLGARGAGHSHQLHMKGREHALDFLADGAVAHQQHGLAGKFLQHDGRIMRTRIAGDAGVVRVGLEAALPYAGALHVEIKREVLQQWPEWR